MDKLKDFLEFKKENFELICEGTSLEKFAIAKFKAPFVLGDTMNLNKRMYKSETMKSEIERMNQRLEKANVPSDLTHPDNPKSNVGKISHVISKMIWDDEKKIGSYEATILKTQSGKDLLTLVRSNIEGLGSSMRGSGFVDEMGVVMDGYKLHGVDIVVGASYGDEVSLDAGNIVESCLLCDLKKKILIEDQILGCYGDAIRGAGFKGSFEDFRKLMLEEEKPKELSIEEEFDSLRDMIAKAITDKFGKDFYVVDFSETEIVFNKSGEMDIEYQKIGYEIKGNEAELTGTAKTVEKKISYEEHQYEGAQNAGYKGSFQNFKEKFLGIKEDKKE